MDLSDMDQKFLGQCCGVGLYRRGPDDPHVCFALLAEDDGNWFLATDGISSYWLMDLEMQLTAARTWMNTFCDPDIENGERSGWKFRDDKKVVAEIKKRKKNYGKST